MADENKRLIPMTIAHTDDNNWRITVEGEDSYFVKGDIEDIKKVCRRIKAKDGENNNKCRSAKVGTYLSMVSDSDNKEHKINVWRSKVPHTAEDFKKLMESKEMKTITLTKNYIVEGAIIPKGTLIEFKEKEITVDDLNSLKNKIDSFVISKGKAPSDLMKEYKSMIKFLGDSVVWSDDKEEWVLNESLKEKLDFLPSDIWEKVKEITDEHERFEFVKAELNKLGDDYSDDEIEDFINKYKTELNESEDDIKPYVNVDNLHFGYNTKYGFIEQGFRKNIIVKNNGKDKTFIFGEVSPKEYAYVVTDVLKGEGDLLEYDVSFKKDAIYYAFENILKDNKITESLTEKEVDGLGDMLDMLEETLESEDYVAKENFKKVLDIAKKDEELLDAWEAMATADDKTFVKKENDFWNRFDKICKPFKK